MDTLYPISTQTAMAGMQGQPTVPAPRHRARDCRAWLRYRRCSRPSAAHSNPAAHRPPIVAPTATPGLPASYTIQKGEFPFCIARRFNVNPNEMLQITGLALHRIIPRAQY